MDGFIGAHVHSCIRWNLLEKKIGGQIFFDISQKKWLGQLVVPVSVFGPHSTRGAGVKMFKDFGLPSEVVCELGS